MSISTDHRRKKVFKQWGWFLGLWCLGLLVTAALSYTIRWLIWT
jgi:hypothetical protein